MLKRVLNWLWPSMPDANGASDRERRAIGLARQYAASADVLWYAGHRSAAIQHAERGLAQTLRLAPDSASESEVRSSEGGTVTEWLDHSLPSLSEADRRALLAAARHLADQKVPALDRDVPTRAGAYFRTLLRLQQKSLTPHLLKLHTRFGIWLKRLRTVLLVALFALGVGYYVTRPVQPASASASASFSATYPASAVIDGKHDSRTTEWILPHHRKVGWVEVKLSKPQEIETVRIKNASHPPHHTYGTKTFRLEVYEDDKLAFKQEGRFGKPDVKSAWFVSDEIDKRADRIRVYVLTNYGPAGGIAEIDWE